MLLSFSRQPATSESSSLLNPFIAERRRCSDESDERLSIARPAFVSEMDVRRASVFDESRDTSPSSASRPTIVDTEL